MAKRSRTERRERERDAVKAARARTKLASLEAGGSPERPLEVSSASTVEVTASSQPCVVCEGPVRVEEHTAESLTDASGGVRRLRKVTVACTRCGVRRDVWFRIGTVLAN